jgi:hypothetical protein
MDIIKPTANQLTVTTANTVYNSPIVYLATTNTASVVTVANSIATIGTFTVPAGRYIFVSKQPTETYRG